MLYFESDLQDYSAVIQCKIGIKNIIIKMIVSMLTLD